MYQKWFVQDLQQPINVRHCESVVFSGDSGAYLVGVRVTDAGEAAALNGSVVCHVIRPDAATVTFSGTLEGNNVSAVLAKAALTIPGQIAVVLQVTSGSNVITLLKAIFTSELTATDSIVDPENVVPSISELLSKIDEMERGTAAANAAAAALQNMTVDAGGTPSGSNPTVVITTVDGHYNISFGLVPAAITNTVYQYQASTSGTTVPTGTWQNTVPNVPQGDFLWTRTTYTWNGTITTYQYSVARQGIDGSGAVSSVQGISPDSNGNVQLPTDATPTTGSTNFMTSGAIKTALDNVDVIPTLTVDFGTISSLPTTKTVTGMTSDMVAVAHELGTPGAFASDITVTTANGSVTLSGTMATSGSSTVVITFAKTTTVTGA